MATNNDDPEPLIDRNTGPLPADKDREFICDECGSRCTVGTDPEDEYGHRDGCSQRPKPYRQSGGRSP